MTRHLRAAAVLVLLLALALPVFELPRAQADEEAEGILTLRMKDISFSPTELTIPANSPTKLRLINEGAAQHSLVIDELGIAVEVVPGDSTTIEITAPAGEYWFYCDLPGHKEAGMYGTLTADASLAPIQAATATTAPERAAEAPSATTDPTEIAVRESLADVPMFRGNPARTGEMPGPGPDPQDNVVELWAFETGDVIKSSPAVVDGVVYVGSWDGNLYAIDAASGEAVWTFPTDDFISSSPAVVDGVVYVGSGDGNLYAIDATAGEAVWTFPTDRFISSSPAVVDGVVYVGSGDGNLYAIDATSGEALWDFGTRREIRLAPAVVDGVVYVSSENFLYAIDATSGEALWDFEKNSNMSSPTVVDGVVYVGTRSYLYVFDAASGEAVWTFEAGDFISSVPAVVDGVVYVGSGDGNLYAIDATSGEAVWTFPTDDFISSSPAVVDGVVYVGSGDGNLYAIDAAAGEKIWAFETGGEISSSLAAADGVIYFVSGSRLVAAGNPTLEMRTATAEANVSATAQAHLDATSTAIAGTTATAQAHLDATTTAVAGTTATAQAYLYATATTIAGATATAETQILATQEAIRLSWQNYFWPDIHDAFSAAVAEFPGMSVDDSSPALIPQAYVPEGSSLMAQYQVSIAGGTASAVVMLAIYPSSDDADAAMESVSGGLIRSGWEVQDVDGIDHNHVCLTVQNAMSSEALCYITRDDALIISNSIIGQPKPDVALLNASDLARTMSEIYDEVDRPDK